MEATQVHIITTSHLLREFTTVKLMRNKAQIVSLWNRSCSRRQWCVETTLNLFAERPP